MGYAIGYGLCLVCRRPFAFNPVSVPSHPWPAPDGPRSPICESCIETINIERARNGLATWHVPDDAYEPIDEADLDS